MIHNRRSNCYPYSTATAFISWWTSTAVMLLVGSSLVSSSAFLICRRNCWFVGIERHTQRNRILQHQRQNSVIKKRLWNNRLLHSTLNLSYLQQGDCSSVTSDSTTEKPIDIPVVQNYIFGYGSLMCPLSRQVTNANLMNKYTIPIQIYNLQRIWCARTTTGYTAMGVQFVDGDDSSSSSSTDDIIMNTVTEMTSSKAKKNRKYCTGVLIGSINDEELYDLDQREASYDRLPVPLDTISTISFIDPSVYNSSHNVSLSDQSALGAHDTITSILNNNSNINDTTLTGKDVNDIQDRCKNAPVVQVWVYVPKHSFLPDASHPILQSYVDIILRGCFNTYGIEFARSFIRTTVGWSTQQINQTNSSITSNGIVDRRNISSYWVNDRDVPMYKRADYVYSKLNAAKIDNVMFDTLHEMHNSCSSEEEPLQIVRRTIYDPVIHIHELALRTIKDSNSVHPMAYQHFASQILNYNTIKRYQ